MKKLLITALSIGACFATLTSCGSGQTKGIIQIKESEALNYTQLAKENGCRSLDRIVEVSVKGTDLRLTETRINSYDLSWKVGDEINNLIKIYQLIDDYEIDDLFWALVDVETTGCNVWFYQNQFNGDLTYKYDTKDTKAKDIVGKGESTYDKYGNPLKINFANEIAIGGTIYMESANLNFTYKYETMKKVNGNDALARVDKLYEAYDKLGLEFATLRLMGCATSDYNGIVYNLYNVKPTNPESYKFIMDMSTLFKYDIWFTYGLIAEKIDPKYTEFYASEVGAALYIDVPHSVSDSKVHGTVEITYNDLGLPVYVYADCTIYNDGEYEWLEGWDIFTYVLEEVK